LVCLDPPLLRHIITTITTTVITTITTITIIATVTGVIITGSVAITKPAGCSVN